MIYINSEGKEIETSSMYKEHLLNALDKNIVARVVNGQGSEEREKAIKNVMVLKEEILIRLK